VPSGSPTHPLALTVTCVRPDAFIEAIRKTLHEAAGAQLSGDRPGVLCVFIPEIRDFEGLGPNNELEMIANTLFASDKRDYLTGVLYASHGKIMPDDAGGLLMTTPGLSFTNRNCRFLEARHFRFFAPPPKS
jgi:hypothetical protein